MMKLKSKANVEILVGNKVAEWKLIDNKKRSKKGIL